MALPDPCRPKRRARKKSDLAGRHGQLARLHAARRSLRPV